MKTNAMVFHKENTPLQFTELEVPELEDEEILVEILASGVCGSDVHLWKGEDPRTKPNMIPGHEGVGVIKNIKGKRKAVNGEILDVGDKIIWERGRVCGKCYYCKILKEPSFCEHRKVYGLNQSLEDYPYLNGCYSEKIILTADMDIFKIEDEIDPNLLVTASCSGATACHGFDLHSPKIGDTVVIVGSGPIGIYSTLLAKLSGANKIIVTDAVDSRLEIAKKFGATKVLNINKFTKEERKKIIFEETLGKGADFCVEAVGYPEALQESLEVAGIGATCLSFGFGQPMGSFPFDGHHHLVRKNLKLQGVWVSDTSHTYQAINLVKKHQNEFSEMVTHKYNLENANEALFSMQNGEAVKAIITP